MTEPRLTYAVELATRIRAAREVMGAELGSEISLLNIKSGTYFTLNRVGAYVWRQIQEEKSLAEIKRQLLSEFDVEAERCESDLKRLIGELESAGLIEKSPL